MQLRQRPDLAVREVEGETILLDQQAGQIHTLNETAAFIWRHCDGTRSAADVAALVAERFDVDPGVAERDTAAAMAQLRDVGLLVE